MSSEIRPGATASAPAGGAAAPPPSALVEAMFSRERLPWALIGVPLGLVEGATVAVFVKKGYAPILPSAAVNLAVALVTGAPSMANIVSFAWANLAHGRSRVGLLVALQAAFAICVGLIAFAPIAGGGLVLTILAVLLARMLWAGVLTVRAAIWTANYPRHVMARVTGRIVVYTEVGMAAVALATGWLLDRRAHLARWIYLLAALAGLAAAWRFRAVRVRREYQLLAAEAGEGINAAPFSLRMLLEILRADPAFRRYMFWMSMYGAGNLMLNAQLVVLFTDRLHLSSTAQVLLLTALPLLLMPLFLPAWARLFDQGHIIDYRSRQCWSLVAAISIMSVAVLLRLPWLLWPGSVMLGASYAGANLGWNLGHNDFATLGRAQHYMGVHVTLTGVRGVLAPPIGMLCFEGLESVRPGLGIAALLIPFTMVTAGAFGFVRMRASRRVAARR
ncbi:MAG TPA: MFS transporter [Steroidobacteraceae bacterium]|nr:MFS transporter [Steroidobacteraceae bacterium]